MEIGKKNEQAGDILVRFRQGESRLPIYLIHPIHGTVLCYGPLALLLGNKQPVYAIQSAGLVSDSELEKTVPAMARQYVDRILKADENGPYILGGWSLGAYIALEMSQILKSMGKEVAHVFSIDNMFSGIHQKKDETDRLNRDEVVLSLLFQDAFDQALWDAYDKVDEQGKVDFLLEEAYRRNIYSSKLDKSLTRQLTQVFYINCLAGVDYSEKYVEDHLKDLPITYFSSTGYASFEQDNKKLNAITEEFREKRALQSPFYKIEGTHHFNILTMPYVKELAEKMVQVINDIQNNFAARG